MTFEARPRCCPCGEHPDPSGTSLTRRDFLKGAGVTALGSVAAGGLPWPLLGGRAEAADEVWRPAPLKVKPILVYDTPTRRPQTSWRNWGGIATEADARDEVARIQGELAALAKRAEFPLEFLPVSAVRKAEDLSGAKDMADAQTLLVYAAGGWLDVYDALDKTGKDRILFCRHKSGPVYLWYEIISPRYLRKHGDSLAVKGVDEDDVVIDSQDELLWRFRALAGLRNTLGTKILAVGGPAAWAEPEGPVPWSSRSSTPGSSTSSRCPTTTWAGSSARPGPTPRPCAGPGRGPTPTSGSPERAWRRKGLSSRTGFFSTRSSGPF